MTIGIAANPTGRSNDDMPKIAGNIPLEQCLSEAHAAGIAYPFWKGMQRPSSRNLLRTASCCATWELRYSSWQNAARPYMARSLSHFQRGP
jgi:hypothetical protein